MSDDKRDEMNELEASTKEESAPAESEGRGMLVVVSSPSGGGKGTLIRLAFPQVADLAYSVSWTTRRKRAGEEDGRHYHFISVEQFTEMRARGEFLESAEVHGNFYGTHRQTVEDELAQGHDIILEIDVQGADSVRRAGLGNVVYIFILPPSFSDLRARLVRRGSEKPEDLAVRLRNARGEVESYKDFDYVLLNDDATRAALQLAAIILAERARLERQTEIARLVLSTFADDSHTTSRA